MPAWLIPGLTATLALVFAVALADQWRARRHTYQSVWAVGMAFFGTAAGCEAVAAAAGWSATPAPPGHLTRPLWPAGCLQNRCRCPQRATRSR